MDRVQVDGVGKRYHLGEQRNLRETLMALARRERDADRELWSLRDVSFSLEDGGALGIVGRNGAGKSTLLKILMRITTPTEGVSRTRGRVAGLLEVGTGFHPELTGRENVYLNAAILGMTRADTARRFDEIVAFAGTERFLDTPVKRYSSGMYLRLAFAVAAHLEPDVLIVDEVLAVGDAEFQRKCIGRMSAAEREGRTVVFVSHDLASLSRLCERTIWLDGGRVQADGPTGPIIRDYLASGVIRTAEGSGRVIEAGPVRVHDVEVTAGAGPDTPLLRSEPFRVCLHVEVLEESVGLDFSIYLTNARGVHVLDESLRDRMAPPRFRCGRYRLEMEVPPVLNTGDYAVGVWIGSRGRTILNEPSVASFTLVGPDMGRPDRAVILELPWTVSDD
jgi:ABC-type polysaccharide/polyol phosphate transport system ATPase subunit